MARRMKGKQLAKHLTLTGSLDIYGQDSLLPNSASLQVTNGGINRPATPISSSLGNIDAGFFSGPLSRGIKKIIR